MTKDYFVVEPEVAGGFGSNTELDHSSGRMEVKKLHYEFVGWLGDQLLESTPCYIATELLANEMVRERLTGFTLDDVEVSTSQEFADIYPNKRLPAFVWLKVGDRPGIDDFGVASGLRLVVSKRALALLQRFGISHAASIVSF